MNYSFFFFFQMRQCPPKSFICFVCFNFQELLVFCELRILRPDCWPDCCRWSFLAADDSAPAVPTGIGSCGTAKFSLLSLLLLLSDPSTESVRIRPAFPWDSPVLVRWLPLGWIDSVDPPWVDADAPTVSDFTGLAKSFMDAERWIMAAALGAGILPLALLAVCRRLSCENSASSSSSSSVL